MVYIVAVSFFYLFQIGVFWREVRKVEKVMSSTNEEDKAERMEKADAIERGFRRQVLFHDFHTESIF